MILDMGTNDSRYNNIKFNFWGFNGYVGGFLNKDIYQYKANQLRSSLSQNILSFICPECNRRDYDIWNNNCINGTNEHYIIIVEYQNTNNQLLIEAFNQFNTAYQTNRRKFHKTPDEAILETVREYGHRIPTEFNNLNQMSFKERYNNDYNNRFNNTCSRCNEVSIPYQPMCQNPCCPVHNQNICIHNPCNGQRYMNQSQMNHTNCNCQNCNRYFSNQLSNNMFNCYNSRSYRPDELMFSTLGIGMNPLNDFIVQCKLLDMLNKS